MLKARSVTPDRADGRNKYDSSMFKVSIADEVARRSEAQVGGPIHSELCYFPIKTNRLTNWKNDSKKTSFIDLHMKKSKIDSCKKQSYID